MHRATFTLLYIFFIFIISCKTAEVTPVLDLVPIKATLDLVDVVDDKVKVKIEIGNIQQDTISYYIPKIVHGTYQSNNYGKFVENFEAFDKSGNQLPVKKIGNNRWKINNARALKTLTYWVNDTFDTEKEHDIFSPTGTNIVKDEIFILNLYGFVGYFDKLLEKRYNLFIKHPVHLEASTSLTELFASEVTANSTYDVDFFALKRYADLVDSPIMYSKVDRVSFRVNDMDILLSIYSPNKTKKAAQLIPQLESVISAQKDFLGDFNSTKKYSILLYLATSKDTDAKGFGALEHNTSTVVVLPESLSKEKLDEALTDIVSHEFFHILTPLTLHSEEIHNFDFNNPKMSRHLWLYEGTTEYFSVLFQIRQGIINKKEFYKRILEKIENSKKYDNTIPFTELSLNILKPGYKENYINVYEKGALISMCVDIILREESDGQFGILQLIKELSGSFGIETPFKDEELFKIIEESPSPNVAAFLKKHVIQNVPIDYEYYLNKVGLRFGFKEVPASYFLFEQNPFIKASEKTKEVVFTEGVEYHNFLRNMGVKAGDVLLSIGDKDYNVKNIYQLFGDSNNWKKGSIVNFKIKRNNQELYLSTKVIAPKVSTMVIIDNPDATPEQRKLLKHWIND